MKISVELTEEELNDVTRVTGISKKGPAIRKLLVDALQLQRRAEISQKYLTGEWSTELDEFEASREAEHAESSTLDAAWR
jgi:hypothetical protein